ncbi:hypothetical protein [uncultured Bacteroides sp.]|uniref:hypothetical protein n=1 Tax=uncultured Bacteroides sp. TaxID=162156 RepID=UPI0025ED44DE|nr:hypothetical protein [uncultured Bacteroides sp.]
MKQLLLISLIVLLYSCSSTNKEQEQIQTYSIIDLSDIKYSNEPLRLSEFIDSISYIRIDEEPLVPDLFNTGVTVTDDAIYLEEDFIYKYNFKGKFIKSLFKKGQGPREAIKVTKAAFDLHNNIVAVDNNKGITFRLYSLEGEHIGDTQKNDSIGLTKTIIGYIKGNEIFYYSAFSVPSMGDLTNMDGPYFIYARNPETDSIIYKQPNYHYNIKATVQNARIRDAGYPLCYGSTNDMFWWKHQSVDTVYHTPDFKNVMPWYVLKKNKSFADYEFCVHRMVLDVPTSELGRKLISAVYPLDNGLLYMVTTSGDDGGVGFCRKNGKGVLYSQKGFINDIDGHFKTWIPYNFIFGNGCVKDGYVYTLINASDFFEEGANPPFPDYTEESNPIIVKFKLREYEE